MNQMIEVRGLRKAYPAFSLEDVSFTLPGGFIMGFIGPNGAGKTTTIKSILNMIHYEGEISLFGENGRTASKSVMDRVGIVMDAPLYSEDWTGRQVESALRPFYTRWDHERYVNLLKVFSIDQNKKVKELSRGMKVKLMVSVALSHHADLLILDEPTSGLDPVARDELMDVLLDFISDENKGVLFSTHITADLEKVADYITYIRDGRLQFTGEKDALMEKYRLIKGGPGDLTQEERRLVTGLREHGAGFEGMVAAQDVGRFSGQVLFEPVSLDQIVVFMNKQDDTSRKGEIL